MNAEIVAIGSELVLGQIVDTNSAFIAGRLLENGIEVIQTTTVADDPERMEKVIRDAIDRSQVIITTGGLGPTEDDLTRGAIANVTGRPLVFQPHLMEQIEAIFKRRNFRMTENNRVQAYIPEGAVPIENPKGTAPGFIVEGPDWSTISIPGVPSEMEYLMENAVIPYLRKRFRLEHQIIQYRVLRACGLGEGALGLQIKDLMKESKNPTVGTLAAVGDVRIRITAKADDPGGASTLIRKMEEEIRKRLGTLIYGVDGETLQGNAAKALENSNLTLSVAETLTAGVVSQKLGATGSSSFVQGFVLPTDLSQRGFLHLEADAFDSIRKDPQRFAELMAKQARDEAGTDIGLGLFGRAVEEQGRGEYGMEIYQSLSTSSGTKNQSYPLGGEVLTVRERASILALDMLRKHLLKIES
jgi:nicotinamide-nucleotide amidase